MRSSPHELQDWLALWRVPGVGPSTYAGMLQHFGSPTDALAASVSALTSTGLSTAVAEAIRSCDRDAARPDLDWLAQDEHDVITREDPRYPRLLHEISQPPPLLFVNGDPAVLASVQLAMVGSRNPTPGGRETAHEFARHLASSGLCITSGLALGVDAASHQGALEAGGLTVGVAATGLDRIYPSKHRGLAHRIAEQGALVSEFPIGTTPRPEHFPRRNRIIAGLSVGTLVVEAALRSGSLITARLAIDQGREVFAIPGSIHNPLARGCHQLIRQGAKLVETAADVLEELRPLVQLGLEQPTAEGPAADTSALDEDYRHILDCMGYDPTPIDTLVQRSGLTPEAVSSMLLILELHNQVASVNGGLYVRLQPRD